MESKKKAPAHLFALAALVVLAAVAAYFTSVKNGFVFDDRLLILEDPEAYGAERLAGHFTGAEGFHKTMGRYYRPLVSVTYGIDKAVAERLYGGDGLGSPDAPRPFHVTNIIIHVVASLLLLRLLLLLFGAREGGAAAALLGALIYAAHPVHTEAVSWISGRTDSLACLFYVAALVSYVRFSLEGRIGSVKWVFLFFAAALLCKEMAVTFPVAALLYDVILGRGGKAGLKQRVRALAGLAGLTILFLAVREVALHHVPGGGTHNYFYGESFVVTAATMAQTLPVYAGLLVWPADLVYHYNGVLPFQDSFAAGPVAAALGFVLLTLAAAIFLRRRRPVVAFSIFFFYLALTPVLNIVPTMTLLAERFLTIPSLALSLLVADLITARWSKGVRAGILLGLGAVVVLFGVMTHSRSGDWRDNETLYLSAEGKPGTVINVNLGNHYARKAGHYGRKGDFKKAETMLGRAEAFFRKALDAREGSQSAHLNLGVLFLQKGERSADAAAERENRGDLTGADRLCSLAEGDFDRARKHLDRALALNPASADTLYTLAALCLKRGVREESIRFLEELQEVSPGYRGTDVLLEKMKNSSRR
jgi:protein O-mannosyl-transferase